MQKNYRLNISIIALGFSSICAVAQDAVKYKDVFLDGKPAKLNISTGEVKLVTAEELVVKTKGYTVKESSAILENNEDNNGEIYYVTEADFYTVAEGETLLDVAKKYSVSLTKLKEVNGLETTLVDAGQKLRIGNFNAIKAPNENTTSSKTSNLESSNTTLIITDSVNSDYYIVKNGNTLFSLARQFKLSVDELKRLNNLNSNLITVGQKLRIVDSVSVEEESNHNNLPSIYIVKSGDNLYRIALNNNTTVEVIKKLNGLTSNLITVGQKLQLH
ncbi:LysM peptidoglycan-binding domain-containing protein [Winogradskyella endarachnes]|uniref:LysM peptidoglycan-binding domain-containing protein n=1 Tax=Winogradskyella endarachnes TaxID=2681965 RepID=A0A6L6U5D5_9FLAO|nr:LysM peptidoglycan-binding domain-containing protein [Winogradskyella endarachnes]MUU77393.1 LysM peptidoglycan-binding domain-containing protein [Winogradskyella endarachnes]